MINNKYGLKIEYKIMRTVSHCEMEEKLEYLTSEKKLIEFARQNKFNLVFHYDDNLWEITDLEVYI